MQNEFGPIDDLDAERKLIVKNHQAGPGFATRKLNICELTFTNHESGRRRSSLLSDATDNNGSRSIGQSLEFKQRILGFYRVPPADDDLHQQGAFLVNDRYFGRLHTPQSWRAGLLR